MMLAGNGVRVYLALGATDMRKSIDGLSILVSQQLQLDPFAGHLFGFWVLPGFPWVLGFRPVWDRGPSRRRRVSVQ